MRNQILLTTILCGCSLTAWSSMPITQPWQTVVMAEDATPEVTTGEISVTTENGSFTKSNGNWASEWTFEKTGPQLTLGCGANNISVANSKNGVMQVYAGAAHSAVYNIAIPAGYVITGYSFDFVKTSGSTEATVEAGGKTLTSSETSQKVEVTGLDVRSTAAFKISGGNYAIDITNFKVTYKTIVSNPSQLAINLANGYLASFNNSTTYGSSWYSHQNSPLVEFTSGAKINNIDIKNSTNEMLRVYRGTLGVNGAYTLNVSKGYRITGFDFDFVATDASKTVTLTDASKKEFTSSADKQHVAVTGLATDTVEAFVLVGGNNAIDITNFNVHYEPIPEKEDTTVTDTVAIPSIDINTTTGSFVSKNPVGSWASLWKSTQSSPYFNLGCGANNMDVNNSTDGKIIAYVGNQTNSCDYTLSVERGWKITGYSFDFVRVTGKNAVTLTDVNGNTFTSSDEVQHVSVDNLKKSSLKAFNLSGGNDGVVITNFKVKYVVDSAYVATDFHTFTVFDNTGSVPYRIPAIGTAQDGSLVAVADYRYSKADIGSGRVDLHIRISHDNGLTWGDVMDLEQFRGDGNLSEWRHDKAAFGDPCIVGDRESPRMMITSCSGFPGFFDATDRHQGWARWYSNDNGLTWGEPEYLDEKFIYEPLKKAGYNVQGFFVGSGKIFQSHHIKRGDYYRLYCAGSTQEGGGNKKNWVLYSDDFGETWEFLGGTSKAPIISTADEPKVEELPNGNVILSSRDVSGRYYNIFTFSGNDGISGSWGEKALSSSAVKGLVANNGCNGEIQIVPVVRKKDGKKTFLALQSLPTSGRTNVSIFYKDLTDEATYTTPANFAKDWDGSFVVCDFSSAYSTWSWQHDNALAFLYEEGGGTGGGYNIVYKRIDIPTITSQKYDFDTSYKYERFNIDWTQADLNKEMASLLTTVKKTSEANTSFVKGDKLITDANQLTCKFGHKEMGGTGGDAQDISNLIDGNPATYYHTYYGAGAQPNGSHFMDVTLPEGQTFQGNIEVDVTRRSGATADHITQFTISGWNNNATDTTQIAVVNVPNASAGKEATCEFTIPEGKSYSSLRFNVTGTTNNRGYWHMAEFQLYPISLDPKCLNALCADAYKQLAEAIATAEAVEKVSEADVTALQTAYQAYLDALAPITSIGGVGIQSATTTGSAIYDLQGRKVQRMVKGVYIVNGKKVVR